MSAENGIPLAVPHFGGRELEYVTECINTNWVSYLGPFVKRFEEQLASATGAAHAVATSSGTAALHTALVLAGVGPGDDVLMPALTFIAPANAVRYCGAWPVLTDVRADDWQWDVDAVGRYLEDECSAEDGRLVNRRSGRRVAALLPVHLLGGMCDVDAVSELGSRYGLPIIEDAAECLGAFYKQRAIAGPCPSYSGPQRCIVTSFNGNKIVTTGGGGAVLTNDSRFAERATHLTTTAKAKGIEFVHDQVGFNYRMTNIAAAMGVAQLERLDDLVEAKRSIAERYKHNLRGIQGLTLHPEAHNCSGTFWMYTMLTEETSSRELISGLNAAGIMSRPIWRPVNKQSAFVDACAYVSTPVADRLYEHGISLPCSVGLSEADQATVIATIKDLT